MHKSYHIPMFALAVLASSSCQEILSVDYSASEPMLVMSAQLRSSETDHVVTLSVGTPFGLQMPADDAQVRLYVNGEFVASGDSVEYVESECQQRHHLSASFKPGDRLRVEAVSGDMEVYAENVFPDQMCSIRVDSSSVSSPRAYSSMPDARLYSFVLTLEDVAGQSTLYRALLPSCWLRESSSDGVPYLTEEVMSLDWGDCYGMYDPVFGNLESPISPDMEAATGLVFTQTNYARIFSDELFRDGEYVFHFDEVLDQADFNSSASTLDSWVIFYFATLNEDDYMYYNYYNAVYSSSLLSDLIPTCSNVVGGSGYVATMTTAEARLDLKTLHNVYDMY